MNRKTFLLLTAALVMIIAGCEDQRYDDDPDPRSDSSLKRIALTTGTLRPDFASTRDQYYVLVPNSVVKITITGTPNIIGATVDGVSGQEQTLAVGENTVSMTVTSSNRYYTYTYRVTVIRSGTAEADYASPTIGTMACVPTGAYFYGSNDDAYAIHYIKTPFRISRYEITRSQWQTVMGGDPTNTAESGGTDNPVKDISYFEAIAFCNKLSITEGLVPVYAVTGVDFAALTYADIPTAGDEDWNKVSANWAATGYRLPTATEWRWAAMGAQDDLQKPFAGSTGSNAIGDYAIFGYGAGETGATTTDRTGAAGIKTPNELLLYDMSGNVREICWGKADLPGSVYYHLIYADSEVARTGYYENYYSLGGSWRNPAAQCSVNWYSTGGHAYHKSPMSGLRVVRN